MIKNLKLRLSKDTHLLELLKGSSIAFIFKIMGIILSYIFTLLIAKWYGASTMGLYALSLTLLNIFTIISLLGFDNALVKFVANFNSNEKPHLIKEIYYKTLTISIPLGLLLSFILFFNADFFAKTVFHNESLSIFFKIISFTIVPFTLIKINGAIFRGLKKIKEFSFFDNILTFLLASIFLSIFSFFTLTNESIIQSYSLAILFTVLISFKILKNKLLIKKNKKELNYKNILATSFPMLLASSFVLIMGWTDIIMLGIFRDESEVGVYSILIKLAAITSITLTAINTIAAPKFAEFSSKNDSKNLRNIVQSSTKMIFYSTLPTILILVIFPNFILNLFGEEFTIGIIALWILMFGQFINAISGSVGYIMQMTGYQKTFQYVILIATLINVILNYYLIPIYGINGAAFSSMISMVFWNTTLILFIKSKLGFTTLYIPKFQKKGH